MCRPPAASQEETAQGSYASWVSSGMRREGGYILGYGSGQRTIVGATAAALTHHGHVVALLGARAGRGADGDAARWPEVPACSGEVSELQRREEGSFETKTRTHVGMSFGPARATPAREAISVARIVCRFCYREIPPPQRGGPCASECVRGWPRLRRAFLGACLGAGARMPLRCLLLLR